MDKAYPPIQANYSKELFIGFGVIMLISLFAAIATGSYYLAGIPVILLIAYLTIVDFRKVFYLLCFSIPLSTEIVLPNGFGTDLPTEPLMIGLMVVGFVFLLKHGNAISSSFIRHPLSLLLLLHVGWILISAITSQWVFISIKFLLAKIWYVSVFYFLAGYLLKNESTIKAMFWCFFIPMLFTIIVTLIRHAGYDFSFEGVNRVLHPFYRNHVAYASVISLFLPFVWYARKWYRPLSATWWFLMGAIIIYLIAIQLSYTRAAYVAISGAAAAYFVIRFRLMKIAIALSLIAAIGILVFFTNRNSYLDYAPNYEKTVTHYQFDNLVEATYKMEDISTMERLYRWIAGFHMAADRPWLGFGPGNFYNFYKSYTVTSFQTYVSNNPEKSGIHSYYLMTLVEQGFMGLAIFLALSFYTLLLGEKVYHQANSQQKRRLALMVCLSVVVVDVFLIINDLIETDKVGSFFFICMAILVNLDVNKKKHHEFA